MWSIGCNSVRLLWVRAQFHDGAVQSMSLHLPPPRASNASCGVPYAFAGSQGYMVSGGCDGIIQYVRLRQPEQASASFEGGSGTNSILPPGQALGNASSAPSMPEGHERCRKCGAAVPIQNMVLHVARCDQMNTSISTSVVPKASQSKEVKFEQKRCKGHVGAVNALHAGALSCVSGGDDCSVRIWQVRCMHQRSSSDSSYVTCLQLINSPYICVIVMFFFTFIGRWPASGALPAHSSR